MEILKNEEIGKNFKASAEKGEYSYEVTYSKNVKGVITQANVQISRKVENGNPMQLGNLTLYDNGTTSSSAYIQNDFPFQAQSGAYALIEELNEV